MLLVGAGASLTLPRVQTYLITQAKGIIFDNLGIKAELGSVDVGLPKWLILRDVVVYDKQNVKCIKVKSLEVELIDFSLRTFWKQRDSLQTLSIGRIELNDPELILYKSCRNGRLNLEELFASDKPQDTTKKAVPLRLNAKLSDLYIENGCFAFTDSTKDASFIFLPKRMNFNNLEINKLNLLAHIESNENRYISVKLDNLSLKEKYSGFSLDKLSTHIINDNEPTFDKAGNCVREGTLKLKNLSLHSGKTHIEGYAELPDQSLQTLLANTTPLNYYVYLQPSTFEFEVLDYFTHPIPPRGVIKIQRGSAYGDLKEVHAHDIVAFYGADIQISADASVTHFDEKQNLWIDVKLTKGTTSGKALRTLLPNVKLPTFLDNIEKSDVSGTFLGHYYDFVVDTDIHSPLGRAKSNLHLQIPPDAKVSDFTYGGDILTENLNFDKIGILPNRAISQDLNFNGKVQAKGTDWKKMELTAKGTLVKSSIMGYKMDSVFADVHILKQKIDARTWINDGTGRVNADIALDLLDMNNPGYKIKGDIRKFNFQKYKILPQELVFSGTVDVDLRGTNLDNLRGYANIKNGVFHDGAGQVNADITLDLSNPQDPSYKIKGEIQKFNFLKYKILDKNITFSGLVDVDMKGMNLKTANIDYLTGFAHIRNGFLTYIKDDTVKNLKISDIALTASHPSSDSVILDLQSSIGKADVKGRFTLTKIIKDVQSLITETQLYFGNNDSAIQAYYKQKILNTNERNLLLNAKTGPELNRVFDFFNLPIYISDTTVVGLDVKFAMLNSVSLKYRGDSLSYVIQSEKSPKPDTICLKKPSTTLNFIKNANQNSIILNGITESSHFSYNHAIFLEKNYVDLNAFNEDVDLFVKSEQVLDDGKRNTFKLGADISYTIGGQIVASIDPKVTKVNIANYDWKIQGKNRITYLKGEVFLDTLTVVTDSIRLGGKKLASQNITAYGIISKNPKLPLFVWIKNLDLTTIDNLYNLGIELAGNVNAEAKIYDIFKLPKVQVNGIAKKVMIGENGFGDFHVDSRWDQIQEKVFANVYWITKDTLAQLTGNYSLTDKINPLDFHFSSQNDLPLSIAAPFIKDILYDVSGGLQIPSLTITGSFKNINLKGDGKIKNASLGIDFLKTKYTFSGDLSFDKNRIEIKRLYLYDKYQHAAEFYATFTHNSFKDLAFDLQLEKIKDVLVMETTQADNPLFNGTIFVKTGLASITGNLKKINIQAFGVTGKNSIFRLPISSENNYGRPDYIQFVGLDTLIKATPKAKTEIEINITVQATDEAEAELIFDEKIGDKIQGRGNGTINISLSPQSGFVMNGMYEITEGKYLFTSQNALGKNFDVKSGGRIIWDGDPANAAIDLQAIYHVPSANAKALIGSEKDIRVPVNVVMHLLGELMHPQIEPSIELPSISRSGVGSQMANDLQAKIKSFEFSPQEMNRQVMSLMIFNQFAADATLVDAATATTTGAGIGGLATTSISEFLSNQVNYWLSKSVGNNVNVALSSSNFQDVSMLISAKFFNDRVTVERDGTVVGNNTSLSIGNINVIVKLLPSPNDTTALNDPRAGELNLEVFNRSSIGSQQTNAYQVGAGVFYKKDFDSFGDLFRRKKKRHINKK